MPIQTKLNVVSNFLCTRLSATSALSNILSLVGIDLAGHIKYHLCRNLMKLNTIMICTIGIVIYKMGFLVMFI